MDVRDIQVARFILAQHRPYLASALWALAPHPVDGLRTVAVDRYLRLYYDPELTWAQGRLATALYHETMHVLRDHAERAEARDPRVWNLAADAAINDDLDAEGVWEWPVRPVRPSDLGLPVGGLEEAYYDALTCQRASEDGSAHPDALGSGRCGGAAGRPEPYELGPPDSDSGDGVPAAEVDMVRRRVAADIAAAAQEARGSGRGSVPGHLARWAEQHLAPPRVPWQRELRAAIASAGIYAPGATDYTWRRPSRRSAGPVVLPSVTARRPDVAVIVDTSGSVSDADLQRAMAELRGILRAIGAEVTLLAADAAVRSIRRVTQVAQADLRGGGGTDMRVPIAAAERLRPRPDVLIVLTDGDTPWPDAPPAIRRVIVAHWGSHTAPKWARAIRID